MKEQEQILAAALAYPPGPARTEYVESLTEGLPERRREILRLLEVNDEAGSFLQCNVWERDSTLLSAGEPGTDGGGTTSTLAALPKSSSGEGLAELGPFLLLELVGSGGTACVFRARDQRLGREVAIKILKPALAGDPEHRRRFIAESRTIASLRAEQIINVLEVGEYRELTYFVMEYLSSGTLQTWLSRHGPLTYHQVLTVGLQVLAALRAASELGLLHRDIKPSNVLVERFPDRVKLSDFGLARSESESGEDRAVGTPQFSSPEQIRGEPVDGRTDLFGFGCLLYSLLVGQSPFAGTSRLQTIHLTLEAIPEPFSHFGVRVPVEFQQLVSRLLAKRQEDRPKSLAEVEGILRRLVEQSGGERGDRRSWLGSAAKWAILGGLGYAFWLGVRPARSRPLLSSTAVSRLNFADGSLAAHFHSAENAELVTSEKLTLTQSIFYWRVKQASRPAKVTYCFEFVDALQSCRLFCPAYLAVGFDETAWMKLWVGSSLGSLREAVSLRSERLEYWPEPGRGDSLPGILTGDNKAFHGPRRWLDLSSLLRGHKRLYLQAEMFATRDVLTWQKVSLGPAAAQFLRVNPGAENSPLLMDPRPPVSKDRERASAS